MSPWGGCRRFFRSVGTSLLATWCHTPEHHNFVFNMNTSNLMSVPNLLPVFCIGFLCALCSKELFQIWVSDELFIKYYLVSWGGVTLSPLGPSATNWPAYCPSPNSTLTTTNPKWPDLRSNPGHCGGKPATNRLRYVWHGPSRWCYTTIEGNLSDGGWWVVDSCQSTPIHLIWWCTLWLIHCQGYVKMSWVSWFAWKMFTMRLCDCKAFQVKKKARTLREFKCMSYEDL
jgi:hypothetical protein